MRPDTYASDIDHDTFMGHGPEPEDEPRILVRKDGPIRLDPEVCVNWDEAFAEIERFPWQDWNTCIHVGMHDIEILMLRRHTPKEVADRAAS